MLCVFQEASLRSLQVASELVFIITDTRQAIEKATEKLLCQEKQDQAVFSTKHHGIPELRKLPSLWYFGHARWPGARTVEIVGRRSANLPLHHIQTAHSWTAGKFKFDLEFDSSSGVMKGVGPNCKTES